LLIVAIEAFKVNTGTDGLLVPYFVNFFTLFNDSSDIGVSVSAAPSFPLTENNVIKIFLFIGIISFLLAIVFALIGRKRKENSVIYAGPLVVAVFCLFCSVRYLSYLI